jgi:hypothetical protein
MMTLAKRTGWGLMTWLTTALLAYRSIRAGDTRTHQRWMIVNYALTFAAVTLRIQLPLSGALGIPFDTAYPIIAWSCWVPNLLVAAWIVQRMQPQRVAYAS